ncbi:MAG: flagellar hook-associated protein FlgK, partial [Anaerolineaceae bacterium]|nr:flagellar hook-associated protein FlgK [Anaerolineaceae bacterium]
MGIYSALGIGRSALMANQSALEVVGNNIANAATPNYSRRVPVLTPGISPAGGVRLEQITRSYDQAIESRLRGAISDAASQTVQHQTLTRIEGLYNEMTDSDISTALTGLFNSFSELANDPQDLGLRT